MSSLIGSRIRDHRMPGPDLARNLAQRRGIAARADRLDAISLRLALDQIERARADRAGGAEDGDAAHAAGWRWLPSGTASTTVMPSPYQQPARGASKPPRSNPITHADKRRRPEAVEPIHHAAMTGNELACILGAELALDPGFEQIAALRHTDKNKREGAQSPLC